MTHTIVKVTVAAMLCCMAGIGIAATPPPPPPRAAPVDVKIQTPVAATPVAAKISIVTPDSPSFGINEALKFYVLADAPSKCDKLTVSIDDNKVDVQNVSFPYTLDIKHTDAVYPKTGGKHTIMVTGAANNCKGSTSAIFATKVEPPPPVAPPPAAPPKIGTFDNFSFTGLFNASATHYQAGRPIEMDLRGSGACQLDIALKGKTGTMYTRRVMVTLPSHYVGEYNMPPYGHLNNGRLLPFGTDDKNQEKSNDETYSVTVTPVTTAGPPAQVCIGQAKVAEYKTKCMQLVCQPTGQNSAPPAFPPGKGKVTAFNVSGFTVGKADGKIEIDGGGVCGVRITVFDHSIAQSPDLININKEFAKLPFPIIKTNLGPLPNGTYRAYALALKDSDCVVQGPNAPAEGWYVDFKVGTGVSSNTSTSGGTTPPGGSGYVPPKPASANGNVAGLQVPGGSFAEDETQRLQVNGSGGCAMDLRIWNTAYGGSFDKTFDVKPLALAAGPMLYNGTNFDTLAEGSYSAAVKGKAGCTGNAAIDFKVTAKTSTASVKGKPTLTLDKQPMSGGVFAKKDSSIWFKVALPPSIKGTQFATCCDVEFNYKNSFGGWEVYAPGPYFNGSWSNAMTLPDVAVPQSVSGFKQGSEWRMKVRASKFKTIFEWSDWLEFKVDQN